MIFAPIIGWGYYRSTVLFSQNDWFLASIFIALSSVMTVFVGASMLYNEEKIID